MKIPSGAGTTQEDGSDMTGNMQKTYDQDQATSSLMKVVL